MGSEQVNARARRFQIGSTGSLPAGRTGACAPAASSRGRGCAAALLESPAMPRSSRSAAPLSLAVLCLAAVSLTARPAAAQLHSSSTVPIAVSVNGEATITSRWIDKDACNEGYHAELRQKVEVRTTRPVRTRAFVLAGPAGRTISTDQPTAGPVTATTRRATWTALPPLGCSAGLLEPKPVPPATVCPTIRGRFEAALTSLPPKSGDPDDLAPIGKKGEGGEPLLMTLTRQTGPRSVRCAPDLPPRNTEPVGKDDADGAPVVAAMPWDKPNVFVSFPLAKATASILGSGAARSKREWIVRISGDCTDQNVTGRKPKKKPGPDGDELTCTVSGRFTVTIRGLRR